MEMYEVTWQGQTIRFELKRKNVRNINLNLKPDMTVMVSANERVPIEVIQDFVKSKAAWIIKNTSYFDHAQPGAGKEKEYVSGETFKYLGRQIRLKVAEGTDDDIRYRRGYLQLTVKDKSSVTRKEAIVQQWFRQRAKKVFHEVVDKTFPIAEKHGVKKPIIKIRRMKTRWGSCVKAKSIIVLNSELMKAPKYCIEYVVLHELVHFIYPNHSADFFGFLASIMPDWQERKRILDEEVIRDL